MTEDIKREFQSLACQLSPENLSCDGELSNAQTNQRYRQALLALAGVASIILIVQGVYQLVER